MSIADIIDIGIGITALPLMIWFYLHCARPSLALAGARPPAFDLTLAASITSAVGTLCRVVDNQIVFPIPLDDALDWSWILSVLVIVPVLAYFVPRLVVRLTGGPDGSVPVRFYLGWLRRELRRSRARDDGGMVRALARALSDLGPPTDVALLSDTLAWLGSVDLDINSEVTRSDARHQVLAYLDEMPQVDRLGSWI